MRTLPLSLTSAAIFLPHLTQISVGSRSLSGASLIFETHRDGGLSVREIFARIDKQHPPKFTLLKVFLNNFVDNDNVSFPEELDSYAVR